MATIKEKYREIVILGKIESVYTILKTYKRYDGEVLADCQVTCNNITPTGIVSNDCGIFHGVSLRVIKEFDKVN